MVFVHAKTRAAAIEAKGCDWAKIVKVEGGYAFFNTMTLAYPSFTHTH
jgi:hypothetical protein